MNKSLKTTKGALCSLASVLSSGALMVSNVSAATITYYSGTPANDGDGTSVLAPTLQQCSGMMMWRTCDDNDAAYRGLYNIGSVAGVLDDAAAENTDAFTDIIKEGFAFNNWKTSYYRWNRWNDNGIKTAGTDFSSTDYDLKAVAQWTDLKKAVELNGTPMTNGVASEIKDADELLGEVTFSYKINLVSEEADAPVEVKDIDENLEFEVKKEGYEFNEVLATFGEDEPIDITSDVQDDGKVAFTAVDKDLTISATMAIKKFAVTAEVSDTKHANITPEFENNVAYGDDATFNVIVNKGYEIAAVREAGGLTDYEVVNGKLVIEDVKADMSFIVVVVPEEYTVMEGEDQVFDATKGEDLVIRFSGELDQFEALHIDGQPVDEEHYTAEPGSTIITIDGAFIAANYAEGPHDVEALYQNGNSAKTTFEIPAPKTPDTGANSKLSASTIASVLACAATGSILALIMLGIKRKMNR